MTYTIKIYFLSRIEDDILFSSHSLTYIRSVGLDIHAFIPSSYYLVFVFLYIAYVNGSTNFFFSSSSSSILFSYVYTYIHIQSNPQKSLFVLIIANGSTVLVESDATTRVKLLLLRHIVNC